jgi:DNA-binding transcriptional LysR family regulator
VKRLIRARLSEELRSGSVDLALGWVARVHDEVAQHRLFDEDFVCILRPNHPRVGRKLSLKQFASEWHLLVGRYDDASENLFRSLDGDLERQLAQRGIARKIAMRVPHFLSVPNVIASTDLLCVVPRRLADVYAAQGQVRFVPLPVPSESFRVSQFWHRRFEHDQGNRWLRETIRALFGEDA